MDVGELQVTKDQDQVTRIQGWVQTLDLDLKVQLHPYQLDEGQTPSDRQPSHDVFAIGRLGQRVKVGAAWKREVKKDGPSKGDPFFSMQLDDPSFARPLNVTAFRRRNDPNTFRIVFDRPRGADAGASDQAEAS